MLRNNGKNKAKNGRMINVVCARGERYARILTTSPKFTLEGERIAVRAAKEKEGRFDRRSFKHGVFQLRANFRRGKSEGRRCRRVEVGFSLFQRLDVDAGEDTTWGKGFK